MFATDDRRASNAITLTPTWENFDHETAFQCHVILWPEDEGGYSAHCANLIGVVSQGDTIAEAMDNIADAFKETLAYYRDAGERVPWGKVEAERPSGYLERRILVRA